MHRSTWRLVMPLGRDSRGDRTGPSSQMSLIKLMRSPWHQVPVAGDPSASRQAGGRRRAGDRRLEGFEGAPFKEISINSDSLSFPIDLPVSLGLTAVFLSQSDLRG